MCSSVACSWQGQKSCDRQLALHLAGVPQSKVNFGLVICRSGADKISIGSDAVDVVEEVRRSGRQTGASSIEQISWHYGAQAVVVSIDPRRVYVAHPAACSHQCVETDAPGGSLLAYVPSTRQLAVGMALLFRCIIYGLLASTGCQHARNCPSAGQADAPLPM
jgi:imidazole glycerol phosphate synthase subunit HisF